MMETIQDVLQLILQADDIKYVKNSGILNYGLDLKQVVEREIELSVCKGDKEILLAMNYDIEQCSVQFQIVDCTEEEEKKIIDLDFALNGAETAVDFTQALNLYLLSIGYIDEDNLEEYRQKVSRLRIICEAKISNNKKTAPCVVRELFFIIHQNYLTVTVMYLFTVL